jgi:2,5-diketo-D-gluconate reductase A
MATLDPNSTVRLHTGRMMPVIGLGTWQLTNDTAGAVAESLRLGYPMIDTSGDYGTQRGIAEGVKRAGVKRGEYYLVTKIEEDDDVPKAVSKNLGELAVDHADLILIHRPPKNGAGELLWEGLIRARDEGRTTDIGVSNYSMEQIDALIDATGETPAVNQIEWSPFGFSRAMLDYARDKGMVVQAYSPLTRDTRLDDDTLNSIAARHGRSAAQILIRWDLQRGVVPIPKANRRDHMEENLDVFDFELSNRDMADLDALNERYSALGRLPYA